METLDLNADGLTIDDLFSKLDEVDSSSNTVENTSNAVEIKSISSLSDNEDENESSTDSGEWTRVTGKMNKNNSKNFETFSKVLKSNLKGSNEVTNGVVDKNISKKAYPIKDIVTGVRYEFMFNPEILSKIMLDSGYKINVDLFANQYSKQCDTFYHFDKDNKNEFFDSFKSFWGGDGTIGWVNYPFKYLKNILKKIKSDNAEALVLVHKSRDYDYTSMLESMYDWSIDLEITDDLFLIANKDGLFQPNPPHLPQNAKYSIVHIPKIKQNSKPIDLKMNEFPDLSMNKTVVISKTNVIQLETVSNEINDSVEKINDSVEKINEFPVKTNTFKSKTKSKKVIHNYDLVDDQISKDDLEGLLSNEDISTEVKRYMEFADKIKHLKSQINKLEKNKSIYSTMIQEYL